MTIKKFISTIINYVTIDCTMSNNDNRGLASADEKT